MSTLITGFQEGLASGFQKIASTYNVSEHSEEAFISAAAEEFGKLLDENGIDKEASFGAEFAKGLTSNGGTIAGALGLGAAAIGGKLGYDALRGLGTLAVNKVGLSMQNNANRATFDRMLSEVIKSSEVLQNDPLKAKKQAESIFRFAPHVACDPNILRNVLDNSIYGDSIDLQTIRTVTEMEEKLLKAEKARNM